MSSKAHKEKIWGLIKDIKVGMLTTQDGQDFRARPMHLVQDEYDGTLWFFTKKSAEKVFEAEKEHHVCVTFSDKKDGVHVSLSGKAQLSNDRNLIKKFWGPFIAPWFDGDENDPEIVLLEIKISQGEHWESEKSKVFQMYELAKANLTDTKPDVGTNEKFG